MEHLGSFVVGHLGATDAAIGSSPPADPPRRSPVVRKALVAAFETFAADWSPGDWMICDSSSGGFVQFMRESDGVVSLDLPVEQLDPTQLGAARRLILEDLAGGQVDDVALQLELPMQPSYLAHMTLDVFDRVFGARAGLSLTVTLEGNTKAAVRFQVDDESTGDQQATSRR